MFYPKIIQGGMGVAVSNYQLAKAVSQSGHLGVVSGTMIDTILARRLQDGDKLGHFRRAIEQFPIKKISQQVLNSYFIEGGKAEHEPYKAVPMHGLNSNEDLIGLTILANFVEVFLAKEGHDGVVGINYLTKIDLPTLPSLFGAMLAGVDYVLMGAGIPKSIPAILDQLSQMQSVSLKIDVEGRDADDHYEVKFDPQRYGLATTNLKRPLFLAIVSSAVLAQSLSKKASGSVDGFVVEHHCAGGHNAPPRGGIKTDERGEPIYGPKDEIDIEAFKRIGLPFWLAGGYGTPEGFQKSLESGANGIQAGSIFAFCDESGITDDIKKQVIDLVKNGEPEVFTDPVASASKYPFKVVPLEDSLSDEQIYLDRLRICDLGYLRQAYKKENGSVGFRCPGEPVEAYVRKEGLEEETCGRKCLCNGLMSTVGFAQIQSDGYKEPPLVTAGKHLASVKNLLSNDKNSYSASDVLAYLQSKVPQLTE